jgi:3-deoxy-D-manno-octulosonic-acid transferase
MTRVAYAILWLLAVPFAWLRLLARSRKQPGYRERIGERFGRYDPVAAVPRIWVHAVSVGETRAALPIVDALARRHPDHRILITHMTATGRATGVELFGDRVERAWLPYDLGFAARRFLAHYRPRFGIVLETEIWPRLLEECARAGVPVVLANARLSERSARRYARFPAFTRWALANLAGIAAQTQSDADRLRALGAHGVEVTGNVKFDQEPPGDALQRGAALRARLGPSRPVWVAGSTREGEEALLLDAFQALEGTDALLAIVPRHPHRFDAVADLARARGLAVARRSDEAPVAADVRVFVGDSMGEMPAYYAAADVVVMGGSLLPYGSQNLIEPCALGKPVIVGPHTYNFEEAAEGAIAAGAALRVRDAREALEAAAAITRDVARRALMGENARAFVVSHRGAVGRFADWLEGVLSRAVSPGRAPG